MIHQKTFDFLSALNENNNREWFHANKAWYDASKNNFIVFAETLLARLKNIQPDLYATNIKDCIFRINRDVRFSANKNPYKINFSAAVGPGGKKSGRIDYYLHIENNNSFLGGGMWQPTPQNLAKFRQEIDYSPEVLKNIIFDENFQKKFTEIYGEQLKNAPKGYSTDHPEINLLRYKELFFTQKFTNEEVLNEHFLDNVFEGCVVLKPYLDYLNELFYGTDA